jgi:hypothetical protein
MTNDVLAKFLAFSAALADNLSARSEVIGLVLVGSTADTKRVDEWSDHDFFVFTQEGRAEELRQDLSWLPNHDQIAMRPRETAHGLKVVYESGQVLEFAVFNDSELEIVSVNDYSVAVDKTNITERMQVVASRQHNKHSTLDDEFDLFLANILIGVGRARRGEATALISCSAYSEPGIHQFKGLNRAVIRSTVFAGSNFNTPSLAAVSNCSPKCQLKPRRSTLSSWLLRPAEIT